jgi:proline iminopeptidase
MRAPIRDTEIFFDIDGPSLVFDGAALRERPTALVVHGGPGTDHSSWKLRYGSLTQRMQIVYFDHRGQGRSARGDPEKYTLDENVEDMEALRQYLGLGPIVSIGGSYGGMVAMAHAARYPNSVSHLVLISTAAHGGFLVRAKEIVRERGTSEQVAAFDDLLAGNLDSPEKLRRYFEVTGTLYACKHDPKVGVGLGPTLLEPEPLNRAFRPGGFLRRFDLRPELSAIAAPTLIIAGRHDWICAPEFAEEMQALIPDADLRIFEQSAHSVGGDEPQQFLDAVLGFLVYKGRTARAGAANRNHDARS